MESERQYELRNRSRSRSQTPMALNRALTESEQIEHHYDLRSRSRERSRTPEEVTSSRRSGSRSLTNSTIKIRDHSMETIKEKNEDTPIESIRENQNRTPDSFISVNTNRKIERRSERQRVKRQIFANGQGEIRDNISNHKIEQKRASLTPQRTLTSDYSSEEGEKEDPPTSPNTAYEIYKQAGEWWNVFPKTDYTYAESSQCRYEIAPGIIAMPNMSRRSIHSNFSNNSTISSVQSSNQQNVSQFSQGTADSGLGDTTDIRNYKDALDHLTPTQLGSDHHYQHLRRSHTSDSVPQTTIFKLAHFEKRTSHKEFIYSEPNEKSNALNRLSSRVQSSLGSANSYKYNRHLSGADSDTELEDEVDSRTTMYKWKIVQWFQSVTTFLTVSFVKVLEFCRLKPAQRREYIRYDYHRYEESRVSRLQKFINRYLSYPYMLLVRILLFDSWLLSKTFGVRKRIRTRGIKVLWVALLPLLLLGGAYITQKHSLTSLDSLRNVPHGVTETTYRIFNDITNLTSFEYELFAKYITTLRNYSLPSLPSVNVSLPEMPQIGWNITW